MFDNYQDDANSTGKPASPLASVWKLLTLGALVLILLVPVVQLLGLVRERRERQESVRSELAASWGSAQTVGAVVLAVPLRAPGSGADHGWAFFLPSDMRWEGTLEPNVLRRGIFEVTHYEAQLRASGFFAHPVLQGGDATELRLDDARLLVGVEDLHGLRRRPVLRWGEGERAFVPGMGPLGTVTSGLSTPLVAADFAAARVPFSFDLTLRGSDCLRFVPVGEMTQVDLASTWPHPAFVGNPSPQWRRVGEGFAATWEMPYFARSFPQQWRQGDDASKRLATAFEEATFGVSLVRPADPYQQTERAVKYAVLFILLTFTTVFLLELLSPVRLHAMSYLLVGAALCLFYLLLLALAEHLGMVLAYAIASLATVALVTLYARSLLAGRGRAAVLGLTLSALYGWLYTVLRAEDYALLLGAGGLFAMLALVMFLTRRLDWGTLRFRSAPTPS